MVESIQNKKDTPVIQIYDLSVTYNGSEVLKHLNLSIPSNEFVVVVGRSGVGKTTLLKALGGFLSYSGKIQINGRMRMVFQDTLLMPWLTVEENVALSVTPKILKEKKALQHGGVKTKTNKAISMYLVNNILDELRIAHLKERYHYEISGGERQRVAVARAFVAEPKVIFCDEPFGQLDVFTRRHMHSWLLDLWKRHQTTILFTTHDIEEALLIADRVCILKNGTIEAIHPVSFDRPRKNSLIYTKEFLELKKRIYAEIVS